MEFSGKAVCGLAVLALLAGSGAARGADVLVYGPSLAPQNGGDAPTTARNSSVPATRGPALVNEATVATDNGHNVTVVDAATWSGMTTGQFAAYDAIVIGDAGCDFSDGEDLAPVDANKAVWSPAVTGNITINTFDAFYHIFQNATVEAGARALAGSGIDFAASGAGTGLYYSNGCRDFGACRAAGGCRGAEAPAGGSYIALDFLSELGYFEIFDASKNEVDVVEPTHPAMIGTSDENLSEWGSSTHSTVETFPEGFLVTAIGSEGGDAPAGGGVPAGPVVIAGSPQGPDWVTVPTLSSAMLGLLALALAGAAFYLMRSKREAGA